MATLDLTQVGMSLEEQGEFRRALFHATIDTSAVLASIGVLARGRDTEPEVATLRDQLNNVLRALDKMSAAFAATSDGGRGG